MTNRKPLIVILINILIGVSWAFVALGAMIAYQHSQHLGIFSSLIFSFFGMAAGFTLVVIFEMCLLQYQKLQETKEQTKLLKEIKESLNSNNIENSDISKIEKAEIEVDSLSHN
jgi:hypothetical protein